MKLRYLCNLILYFSIIALIGCQSMNINLRKEEDLGKNASIVETRVFILKESMTTPAPEAGPLLIGIAAAVAPIAIEKGIDFIGNQIKEAAKAKEKVIVSNVNSDGFYIKKSDNETSCSESYIIVVKGRFGKTKDKIDTKDKNWSSPQAQAKLLSLGLIEMPDFLYEGKIQFKMQQPDNKALENVFKIRSIYLEYNKAFGDGIGDKRDLLLSFLFQKPFKTKPEDKTESFALGTLKFEDIKIPLKLDHEQLRGKETEWMPMPNVPNEIMKSAKKGDSFFVYTLVATITESKDANKYLQLLSDVFEGSKENVKKVVIELVPKAETE